MDIASACIRSCRKACTSLPLQRHPTMLNDIHLLPGNQSFLQTSIGALSHRCMAWYVQYYGDNFGSTRKEGSLLQAANSHLVQVLVGSCFSYSICRLQHAYGQTRAPSYRSPFSQARFLSGPRFNICSSSSWCPLHFHRLAVGRRYCLSGNGDLYEFKVQVKLNRWWLFLFMRYVWMMDLWVCLLKEDRFWYASMQQEWLYAWIKTQWIW